MKDAWVVPQDPGGDISAATNGDDQLWLRDIENLFSCVLTQFVNLAGDENP